MNFNKLDDTNFPNLNTVDVFAYKNDYDYTRFDNAQMTIYILNVPWDMGEAHVGQRTITGIGNVVKFENDAARDEWFASKKYAETAQQWASGEYDGFKWMTKYREFHNGEDLKIPLPFNVVAKFNYAWIEYEPAPDASMPVDYEYNGITKWFWFIRNFQMLSVNTTSCVVKRDTWQTYINHMQFSGMMLEQGHYPLTLTDVDSYLNNPIDNNSGLLEDDIVFGELMKVTHSSAVVLNDTDIKAVIVSSGNPAATWGSKANNNWTTPNGYRAQDGQPSYYAFAIDASSLNNFISNIYSSFPQFVQTIKAVFFVASKLITLGNSFTFASTSCNWVAAKNSSFNLIDLAKSQFGYSNKYAHLAKLYTYPYAALEVTDEKGNNTLIKIEDTSGNLSLQTSMNLVFPWVNIDGRLSGIGGNISQTLSFRNVNAHSFSFSGRWYEYLTTWEIPTFAITQSAASINDYATHFERQQQALENSTAQTNALNANATAKTNTDATADMSVTNTAVQNNTNNRLWLRYSNMADDTLTQDNEQVAVSRSISNTLTRATTNNQIDYANASAAINAAGAVAGGAISGASAGIALGPAGIAAGAAAGAAGGIVGSVTNLLQTSASNNLTTSQAESQCTANDAGVVTTTTINTEKVSIGKENVRLSTVINNDNNETQTANNAGLMKANATRDKNTQDAIANLNKSSADAAINAQIAQAALQAPEEFGLFANGEHSTSRPLAMVANIITQSKDAIEKTGDHFLRYGYAYNKFVEFSDFNLMPRFTYWKCSDIWITNLDMADEHCDEIRFFLMGGVTVWSSPEYIGHTTIYENV